MGYLIPCPKETKKQFTSREESMNETQQIAKTMFFETVFVKNGSIEIIRNEDGLMEEVAMQAPYYNPEAMGCPYCEGHDLILERRNPNAFTKTYDSETGAAYKTIFHGFLCPDCAGRSAKLISAEGHVISFGWRQ
jgi:hypothetical protein